MKPKTKAQKSKTKSLTKLQTATTHNEALEEQLARIQEDLFYLNNRIDRQSKRIEEKRIEITQLSEQNFNLMEAISVLGRSIRLQNQGERFKEESNSYQVTIKEPKENKWSIQKEVKNL